MPYVCLVVAMAIAAPTAEAGTFIRPQHCSYRSFMKELAATRRFADGGMELRTEAVAGEVQA